MRRMIAMAWRIAVVLAASVAACSSGKSEPAPYVDPGNTHPTPISGSASGTADTPDADGAGAFDAGDDDASSAAGDGSVEVVNGDTPTASPGTTPCSCGFSFESNLYYLQCGQQTCLLSAGIYENYSCVSQSRGVSSVSQTGCF